MNIENAKCQELEALFNVHMRDIIKHLIIFFVIIFVRNKANEDVAYKCECIHRRGYV